MEKKCNNCEAELDILEIALGECNTCGCPYDFNNDDIREAFFNLTLQGE